MYVTVLVRRLREGKTYDDFVEAWYPDRGFGLSSGRGPITARRLDDQREILTFGFFELPEGETIQEFGARIAEQEAVRHERLTDVIESTTVNAVYEVADEFDFSTDETVAQGRPEASRGSV